MREHPHTARAVYHRRLLHAAVHATETYGGLANVEVRGDEELGQHDRRGGEAELYAQNLQVLPEQPHPPKREQQRYASGARGQDRRDVHQSIHHPLARKICPGQNVGCWGADDEYDRPWLPLWS